VGASSCIRVSLSRGIPRGSAGHGYVGTGLQGIQLRDLRHTFKTNAAMSGMERAIRNAIVGHATQLPVEDLYIHIPAAKLLEAVDTMTFDHGTTAAHLSDGEKSPVKITSERVEKKKGHVAA